MDPTGVNNGGVDDDNATRCPYEEEVQPVFASAPKIGSQKRAAPTPVLLSSQTMLKKRQLTDADVARFSQIIQEEKGRDGFSRWNKVPPPGYVCRRCNEPGHFIYDCKIPDKNAGDKASRPPPAEYVCNICHNPGHWIQDCPDKAPPGQKRGPPADYLCKICSVPGHWLANCPKKEELDAKRSSSRTVGSCWFCLSSPEVASHLVASVGEEVYLALPKGPILPGHCLLLPISHVPNQAALGGAVVEELSRFKQALKSHGESKQRKMLFWERNIPVPQQHLTVEAVPLSHAVMARAKEVIIQEAGKVGLTFSEISPSTSELLQQTQGKSYLCIELEDSALVCISTDANRRSLLNFARTAVANMLETPR